jgi:chromosome segregation ATPase
MNQQPQVAVTPKCSSRAVITPWLSGSLVVSLVGGAILSGVLLFGEGGLNDTQRRALAAQRNIEKSRIELASLQTEVSSLVKRKVALAPIVADSEQRLKEKPAAEAALTALESKQRQAESDLSRLGKKLEQTNKDLLNILERRADAKTEIEKLRAELVSSAKTAADAKVNLLAQIDQLKRDKECLEAEIGELTSQKTRILAGAE